MPQRTCVVCRSVQPKRGLTRLVRTPDAGVKIDPTGKAAGRGAYLCGDPACWQKAAAGAVLERALRTTLTADERAEIAAHGAGLPALDETEKS